MLPPTPKTMLNSSQAGTSFSLGQDILLCVCHQGKKNSVTYATQYCGFSGAALPKDRILNFLSVDCVVFVFVGCSVCVLVYRLEVNRTEAHSRIMPQQAVDFEEWVSLFCFCLEIMAASKFPPSESHYFDYCCIFL